jgi:hypothetical protein
MSYQLQVLAANPFSYWKLDESGPAFPDSAGSLRTADLVGTIIRHPALVTGSGSALLLSNTNHLDMDDPVFNKGYEQRQFALEAWVKPVNVTGEVAIMSHDDTYDGLVISATHIYFRTIYQTAGTCEVSYEYETGKSFHVLGVHTNAKNSLYVDGQLVAETDLSDEQQEDAYGFVTTDLIAGQSATGSTVAVDAPAIYAFSVTSDIASKHYSFGTAVDTSESIAGFNDATLWRFSDEYRNLASFNEWSTEAQWKTGVLTDVVVADDTIVPSYTQTETEDVVDGLIVPVYENTSLPGVWQTSVGLGDSDTALADMKITWLGEGDFTVEYSIDGTTWKNPDLGPTESLDSTDIVEIRITFDGSIVDDPSFVSLLKLTVYTDKNFRATREDRFASMTGNGLCSNEYYEPIEYADFNGIQFISGAIAITDDDSYEGEEEAGDLDINGFDMWAKPVAGNILSATGVSVSRSGNTIVYSGLSSLVVNGASVSSGATVFNSDSWYHIAGVFTTPDNYAFTVGVTDMLISQMSSINGDVDTAGLQQIYESYLGLPGLVVDDSSSISIAEESPATNLYAHVWGITPAG